MRTSTDASFTPDFSDKEERATKKCYLHIPILVQIHNARDDAAVMTGVINVFHICRAVARVACDHGL